VWGAGSGRVVVVRISHTHPVESDTPAELQQEKGTVGKEYQTSKYCREAHTVDSKEWNIFVVVRKPKTNSHETESIGWTFSVVSDQ